MSIPRRQMLHTLLNTACTSLVLSPYAQLHPDGMERLISVVSGRFSIDEETLDDLEIITQRFWKLRKNTSLDLFSVVIEHFQMVTQLLKRTYPKHISKRLYSLVSQIAQMIGQMLFDIQDLSLAWSYYSFGLQSAQIAENADLRATSFGRMGLLSIHNAQPGTTLTLLEESLLVPAQDMRIVAWTSAIQAEAHAHLNEVDATIKALDRSQECFENENSFGKDVYATGFSRSRFFGYRGACFSRIQNADMALPALQEALASVDVSSIRRQSTLFVDIGNVYAQQGAITNACKYINQALDITTQTRSLSVLQRVRTARLALNGWASSAEVKYLDQRVQDVQRQIAASVTVSKEMNVN